MSVRRVGHKGADLIAPGNTFASFRAALAAGVDMIEFDVLPERRDGGGELLLAHDFEDAAQRSSHTLAEALAHLAGDAYAGVELDVDLKLPGYEIRVLEALEQQGLLERVLVSSMYAASLATIRRRWPAVRLGWSVPRLVRNPMRRPHTAVAAVGMAEVLKRVLPARAARALGAGEVDAIMAHWRLVTPRLARAVREAGGELYVWTVDDRRRIAQLVDLGVTGIITNDPRLFAPIPG